MNLTDEQWKRLEEIRADLSYDHITVHGGYDLLEIIDKLLDNTNPEG